MKDHTTQRTLSLVGIYLLCRFVYLPLQRLIPYYFLGRGFLPKTAFFLLALLLVSRWVSEVPLSPARLFFFTVLAYAADNLGETARYLDIDPISVLLVAWLFLTLLVYQRELPLSRWEFVQVFLSPRALASLAVWVTALWLYFESSGTGHVEVLEFPPNGLLPYLDLLTVPDRPDLLLPQFVFFFLGIPPASGGKKSKISPIYPNFSISVCFPFCLPKS